MPIQVPDDVEARIREKVDSGDFADAGEVIREAMRLLDERELALAQLQSKLQVGLDQLDNGEGIPFTSELVGQMQRDANDRFQRGERPNPDVIL